jgi:hypothetical protein
MPGKTKKPLAELPTIPKELIDQFVKGPMTANPRPLHRRSATCLGTVGWQFVRSARRAADLRSRNGLSRHHRECGAPQGKHARYRTRFTDRPAMP